MGIFTRSSIDVANEESGLITMPHSLNIADYGIPDVATASSEDIITANDVGSTDEDTFSGSPSWTITDSDISLGSNLINIKHYVDATKTRAYRALDTIYSRDAITIEFSLIESHTVSTSAQGIVYAALAEGTGYPPTDRAFGLAFKNILSSGSGEINLFQNSDSGFSFSSVITTSAATQYYIQITVSSGTASLKVFTDARRTIQHGSTVTLVLDADLDDFDNFVFAESGIANTDAANVWIGNLALKNEVVSEPMNFGELAFDGYLRDDSTTTFFRSTSETNPDVVLDCAGADINLVALAIFYKSDTSDTQLTIDVATDAASTTWITKRTINTSLFTAEQWNYIRFNVSTARYIRIRGNSGNSAKLSFYETKYRSSSSNEIAAGHTHITIDETKAILPLDGA